MTTNTGTAPGIIEHAPRRDGKYHSAALALSLGLHLLVAVALTWQPKPSVETPTEPAAISVDLMPEPKPKAEPAPQPPQDVPAPLPKPQLDPAPLADRAAPGEKAGTGAGAKAKPMDKAALRAVRDLMLSAVLRHWRPPAFMRGRGAVLSVKVDVRPGGTLGPPFGRDEPWNPAAAIDGLDKLAPNDPTRQAMEGFYRGLRQAQPFRLPPELAARLPFSVALDFRLDDLP
jgi:hypothetical protein